MLKRLGRPLQLSFFLSTLVASALVSQAALETPVWAAEKANVAVGGFEGAKSDEVRAAFIEALKKDGHYEVTDAEDVKPSTKGKAVVEAAKGLAVNFVIVGKVGKGFNLKLKVMNGATGKVIDEAEIKGGALPKLKAAIDSNGAASVAEALGQEKPKAEEKPKEEAPADSGGDEAKTDEEKPAEASASVSTDNAGGEGLSPLDISAGLRPLHRTFTFHDTIADARPNDGFKQLLKYELPLGPLVFIDANLWLSAFGVRGAAEWFGLTAGYEKGFATESVYAENDPKNKTTLKTNEQQLYVGPRMRLPIGEHMLYASGVWGQHKFILEGDEGRTVRPDGTVLGPLVPDVTYTYVRADLGAAFRFGDFTAGAHVGKRFVLGTGALKTVWFPNVKTSSLEAGVNVGYRLVSMLDLVAGFDWLRYSFDFNPVPRRAGYESYVAGGATDEYLSGYIGFRFHLLGASEKAAAAAAGE